MTHLQVAIIYPLSFVALIWSKPYIGISLKAWSFYTLTRFSIFYQVHGAGSSLAKGQIYKDDIGGVNLHTNVYDEAASISYYGLLAMSLQA